MHVEEGGMKTPLKHAQMLVLDTFLSCLTVVSLGGILTSAYENGSIFGRGVLNLAVSDWSPTKRS